MRLRVPYLWTRRLRRSRTRTWWVFGSSMSPTSTPAARLRTLPGNSRGRELAYRVPEPKARRRRSARSTFHARSVCFTLEAVRILQPTKVREHIGDLGVTHRDWRHLPAPLSERLGE